MKWISTREKLPEPGQKVLMSYNNLVINGFYHPAIPYGGFTCDSPAYDLEKVYNDPSPQEGITHWMPMPEPPEDKD